MPSLLFVTFLVQLLIHLINTFGASTINEILWALYNKLPTPTSKDASEATRLRREVVRLKRELAAVSAQDEFSRWAKLRRQQDKVVADQEKAAQQVQGTKALFDRVVNFLRWGGTTGLRFLLQFWFAKTPMFWVPQGWVPYYVEWILSFPRAPLGSVSIQVWWIACASVIVLFSEAIGAAIGLTTGGQGARKQAMKMEASSGSEKNSAAKSKGDTRSEKKEL